MGVALRCTAVLGAMALLSACTSGSGGGTTAPSTVVRTQVITQTPSSSPVKIVRPVNTGPTKAATATACPFLDQQPAANKVGMRLERITVLRSGGKTVGCRFYALQNSPLHNSEHLPGPNQPAIEIETYRYPSAKDAHNGFVRMSEKQGTNIQQDSIVGQAAGLCFQTHFYPKDKGTDWACAFSKGTTAAVVRTVVTRGALSATVVARAVATRV